MGTIGGNLCLDTRCNYYDQNYEWRKAIDFCMKKDGEICWVATSSPRCLAVSSTDTAPALMALGAEVTLVSARPARGELAARRSVPERRHPLSDAAAGRDPHGRARCRDSSGWRSTYWKLRRRGSFDFPVLSVAAAAQARRRRHSARCAHRARRRRLASGRGARRGGARSSVSRSATPRLRSAAERAAVPARPMDNTDFTLVWRKRVTRDIVSYALRELRGDDIREMRRRISRLIAN